MKIVVEMSSYDVQSACVERRVTFEEKRLDPER